MACLSINTALAAPRSSFLAVPSLPSLFKSQTGLQGSVLQDLTGHKGTHPPVRGKRSPLAEIKHNSVLTFAPSPIALSNQAKAGIKVPVIHMKPAVFAQAVLRITKLVADFLSEHHTLLSEAADSTKVPKYKYLEQFEKFFEPIFFENLFLIINQRIKKIATHDFTKNPRWIINLPAEKVEGFDMPQGGLVYNHQLSEIRVLYTLLTVSEESNIIKKMLVIKFPAPYTHPQIDITSINKLLKK